MTTKEEVMIHVNNCNTYELDFVARIFTCHICDVVISIEKKKEKKNEV